MTTSQTRRPVAPSLNEGVPLAGYALGIAGSVLFAGKGIVIKLAYAEGIDPETLLALRMGLSLPFYLAVGLMAVRRLRGQSAALPPRRLLLRAAAVGVLGFWFSSYTDFLGLRFISASFERLILFTYPLFVALFAAVLFGERVQHRALVAFAASYVGLALIFVENMAAGGAMVGQGVAWVMLAAVSFALYQLLAKRSITVLGPQIFTCVAMSAAAFVALTQFALLRPLSNLMVSPHLFALSLFIAFGGTVLPSFLMSASLQRISAQANATIGTVSPVATMAIAFLILGEVPVPLEMVGALVVMGSIGWFTLSGRRR
ncbi:MAG: DMT family transporter [Xanthobacteraceae bacterium]